jgi:hypothetical protein
MTKAAGWIDPGQPLWFLGIEGSSCRVVEPVIGEIARPRPALQAN